MSVLVKFLNKVMFGSNKETQMKTEGIFGASYWASYFINGDASGMEDEEIQAADAWFEKNEVLDVIDVARDEDGEAVEPFFSGNYDLYADPRFRGGDLIEYVVILKETE